jgi:hypothetical protein
MSHQIIAKQTRSRVHADGTYIRAEAVLIHLDGNEHPYFSLTGQEWKTARHYHNRTHRETGLLRSGTMGDTLVLDFPELEQINALHLADETGAPMHAVANGWHWYTGAGHAYERNSQHMKDPTDTPRERTARHLRISEDELPEDLDRDGFAAFVDTLRPRWQEEADAAIAFLRGE